MLRGALSKVRDPARGRSSQSDTERSDVCRVPPSGSAVCCFERSTLPEHAGKGFLVIRVKRFIESDPIRPVPFPSLSLRNMRAGLTDALRPREGELIRSVRVGGHIRPWAADVDKVWGASATGVGGSPWKALRILFENEELYGSPQDS